MTKKIGPDMINFNYPIPRDLHHRIRTVAMYNNKKVKDIVIEALELYIDQLEDEENGQEEDDL